MFFWKSVLAHATVGRFLGKDGTVNPLRGDQFGALVVQQGGKYAEAAQAGRVFEIANQAAVATTAAGATTYTGLCLGNPVGSGVKLSLLQAGFALTLQAQRRGPLD